jgi:hypothetical protein
MKLLHIKLLFCVSFIFFASVVNAKGEGSKQKEHLQTFQVCDAKDNCSQVLVFDAHVYGPNLPAFLEKAKNLPEGSVILMSGYGRDLSSGIVVGEIIRQRKLNTWVGRIGKNHPNKAGYFSKTKGVCISACAIAFAGGVNRQIDAEDQFGVTSLEATRNNLTEKEYQQALTDTQAYLRRMGANDSFFTFLKDLTGRKVKMLSLSESTSFGLKNYSRN